MHPTVEEQLTAIRRLVDEVAADPTVGEVSARTLADVSRQLRRLTHSLGGRLEFLRRDNVDAATMVASLADRLGPWAAEVESLEYQGTAAVSEHQAHEVNKALRELLARAARELPDDDAGRAGRAALSAYLRERVAADPALNRNPTRPNRERQ